MKKNKKILVCPLDWGIGHASRCVPVIEKLINRQTEVIIGASGRPMAFLKNIFPKLQFVDFPGLTVNYPLKSSMFLKMLISFPKFLQQIKQENRVLKSIARQYHIDAIISDNRFGLWHDEIYCVYMTHQVNIRPPDGLAFLAPALTRVHRQYIKQYNVCWIPDYEGEPNLSGDLSHPAGGIPEVRWIGPLSRFKDFTPAKNRHDIAVFCIISGPEPQRTVFEELLTDQLKKAGYTAALVLGKPEVQKEYAPSGKIRVFSHLETPQMLEYLGRSANIVCRPGYSSIMDLISLGRKAIFVPTPGQTEQAYLAAYLKAKKWYYSENQPEFDLKRAIRRSEEYTGFHVGGNDTMLDRAIDELISHI